MKLEIQPAYIYDNTLSKLIQISLGWWYLHGKLQDDLGIDQGYILNIKPKQVNNSSILLEGIFEVVVIGIDKPCIGFFWITDSKGRGLVVYKDDIPSIKYARQKYINKSQFL